MKNFKFIKIFFSIYLLFSPFFVFALSDVEALDKMHDCTSKEFNKCLDLEEKCNAPCYSLGGGKCLDDCHIEMEKCVDYSRRVEAKYEECYSKKENFIFSGNRTPSEKDFCTAKRMFSDCMDDFEGLCKVSWPKDCQNVNGNFYGKIEGEDDGVTNENLDENLIGLPLEPGIAVSPCVGETPKNSKLCPGDNENVLEYTEKHLVDLCSLPRGSEPKCEYVCKTEYLDNGTCKEEGFFKKILNWLGGLF